MKREINENNIQTFSSRLSEEVWNIDYDDPNVKYYNFLTNLYGYIMNVFLFIHQNCQEEGERISLGFLTTYVKCAANDINYTKDFFKIQLNIETEHITFTEIRLIKKLKELNMTFLNRFNNVQYDMKKTRTIINDAIGIKTIQLFNYPTTGHLTVDNQRVTLDDNIALEFNNYFVNIGKSLRNNSQRHSPGRGKKR